MMTTLLLAAAVTLPTPLVGVWTKDLAYCGKEDTDGVVIEPTAVTFYEARGTLRTVTEHDARTISATVDYQGEGRRWSEANTFKLDGDKLIVSALGQTTMLVRCSTEPKN